MGKQWEYYQNDFNCMTDDEIDQETERERSRLEDAEAWIEAVEAWVKAGRPRTKEY